MAATETSTLPPYGGIRTEVEIPGKTHTEKWNAIFQLCSEGYFPTLGIKLLRGRPLSEAEVNDARKVAVVNQTLVKKFFGQEDPIGRRIKLNMLETETDPPVKDPVFEIIGVVADAKNQRYSGPAEAGTFRAVHDHRRFRTRHPGPDFEGSAGDAATPCAARSGRWTAMWL